MESFLELFRHRRLIIGEKDLLKLILACLLGLIVWVNPGDAKQKVTVGGKTVVVDNIRLSEDQFEITYNGKVLKGPADQLSAVITAIAIHEQKNNRNKAEQRKGESPRVSQQTVRDSDYFSQGDVKVKAQDKVDSRTVELEKRRLEENLQKCERLMHFSFFSNEEKRKRCIDRTKEALKELSDDPEYYFYKKSVRDSRKSQLVIDPRTGRIYPGIPID